MVCTPTSFCLAEPCDDPATRAEIGMCRWMGCCLEPCRGNSDCPQGKVCTHYLTPQHEVLKVCTQQNCAPDSGCCLAPGEDCGTGNCPCWGDLCVTLSEGSVCSALCATASDCPQGLRCVQVPVIPGVSMGVCIP
jgi:hypothetical protein